MSPNKCARYLPRKVSYLVLLAFIFVASLTFISTNLNFSDVTSFDQRGFPGFSQAKEQNVFRVKPFQSLPDQLRLKQDPKGNNFSVYGDSNCRGNSLLYSLLKELLLAWVNIAKENDIEYFIFAGALLGTVRNGDMIPWDFDIDVYVHKKYFPILEGLSEERKFNPGDWKIHMVVQPDYNHNVALRDQTYISCDGKDVTPNYIVDPCTFRGPIGRLFKGTWVEFWQYTDEGEHLVDLGQDPPRRYNKDNFFPLIPCTYMGIDTWCPSNPVTVLKEYFRTGHLDPDFLCKNGTWVNVKDGTTLRM